MNAARPSMLTSVTNKNALSTASATLCKLVPHPHVRKYAPVRASLHGLYRPSLFAKLTTSAESGVSDGQDTRRMTAGELERTCCCSAVKAGGVSERARCKAHDRRRTGAYLLLLRSESRRRVRTGKMQGARPKANRSVLMYVRIPPRECNEARLPVITRRPF